jgi:hypothetical protein
MRLALSTRSLRHLRTSRTSLALRACALLCLCVAAFSSLRGQQAETIRTARTRRFLGARTSSDGSTAKALELARRQHLALAARPRTTSLSAAWTAVGPAQVATALYGSVTGRVTALVLDPADPTGNTLYVGTTGGGIWKSTNAAGPVASVSFTPLTDTLPLFNPGTASSSIPSLSIGALALANGVLLAGTGDPNDNTDSYYGAGILRSADSGLTWTLIQQTTDGAANRRNFFGLGFAAIAFSSANPSVAVAAVTHAAEGDLVNAPDASAAQPGLYTTSDAGVTWHTATVMDGSQTEQGAGFPGGNSATSVVWNPVRQRFYAAIQFHGYFESADGANWTRLTHQPGPGLTAAACPPATANYATSACPIFRGALAVQPVTGDIFALTVDSSNRAAGFYQDVCAASGTSCASNTVLFANALNATPLETSASSPVISQGDYNLALAAAPSGSDTILYAGTIDLYRCSLAAGCTLRNTTNAQNGCLNRAKVAPSQHAIATVATAASPLLYLGNDGGIYRSTDGVNQQGSACSLDDATHFQNLNGGLGSLAEVVSFAQDPTLPGALLAGLGALGTAGTGNSSAPWPQLTTGEGGTVAIDPAKPANWYLSTGAGVNIALCTKGSACTSADFTSTLGAAQLSTDIAAIHAPWLPDPQASTNLIVGTCRTWRGPAAAPTLWSTSNAISAPFATPKTTSCGTSAPVVRSLSAGGPSSASGSTQNAGSQSLYAGLAGTFDGGGTLGGHLFVTTSANLANNTTAWTDAAKSPVSNDVADAGIFNPGGFDISSIAADPHDPTGKTVYATVMGFAANGIGAPHVYRSLDAGAHWLNISSNLPNAPANSVVVDPNDANTLYVALDTGVYVTQQVATCATANCWSVYGTSLPNAPVMQLLAAAAMPTGDGRLGELRAATYGRGIWQIPLVTAILPVAPAIAINPSTVTYSAQQVGTASAPVTITVTNTGNASLSVSSVTTTGDFNQSNTCTSAAIPQGGTCTVQVSFLPTAIGTRSGVLTVYGNVAGGQATAQLSGIGTPPAAIVLTPASLNFPSTTVGATSAAQNITIANTGGTLAHLQTPAVAGDFRLSANTCGTSLAPQVSCTVSIVFAPTASGSRIGTLTLVDDAGTQVASLVGVGTSPATDSLSPMALSFSAQQLSTTSAPQQITLTNAGDVPLTLISAQITSGDFSVISACGNSLNPHSSCALSAVFTPKSIGTQSGTLAVADQFRTQTIQLSGIGVAPPGVSLSPANGISFPATGVSLNSATQTVTLTNNGGLPLSLSAITVTGDFVIAPGSNTCGTTVAPAAVCTVQIGFAPTASGARIGTLSFIDNAANSPQVLQLTGTGVDFTLASNGPSSLTITSGQTATYPLLLTAAPGISGSVPLTCSGVPAHSTCTVNPTNGTLGGTQTISVTVATGLTSAALELPATPWSHRAAWFALLIPMALIRRRRGSMLLAAMLLTFALTSITGCAAARTLPGNGSGGGGGTLVATPPGTYTLLVAGSSAGLVRSVNLTLIVQ